MKMRSFVITTILLVMFFVTLSTKNTHARPLDVVGSLSDIPTVPNGKIIVSGSYAYVASGQYFYIIDISDKTNPTLVSKYIPRDGNIHDIAIQDNYAYLTAYEDGVHVVDISDPTNPYAVGYFDDYGSKYYSIKIDEDKAYVSTVLGLVVLDISDPTDPQYDEAYNLTDARDSDYYDVALSDGLIFIGYEGISTLTQSSPSESEILGSYDLGSDDCYTRILNKNGYVYALRDKGFDIFYMDTTDDTNDPVWVYSEDTENSTYDIYLDGSNLYLSELGNGIKILNVYDPSTPVVKNTSTDSGLNTTTAIYVSTSQAYVLSDSTFYILEKKRITLPYPAVREILSSKIME